MAHALLITPKRTDTVAFQDAQKLPQRRIRSVVALALAAMPCSACSPGPAHRHSRRC